MADGIHSKGGPKVALPSAAFTFKLNQAIDDNGGIYLIIQASEGQSNGVSRGYGKASVVSDDAGGFSCVRQDLTKLVNR